MLIAQFSDTHITAPGARTCGGTVDANAGLAAAVETLGRLRPRPDCLLVTGDLTDQGRPEQYRALADLLAPVEIPIHLGIGNHDERSAMLAELELPPLHDDGAFVQYAVDDRPVRMLFLDSTSDEHHMGEFCERRLEWLTARLDEDRDRPTLVTIHHPPFATGIAFLDGEGPGWADDLIEVLARSPQVALVVSGHVHRSIQSVVAGRLATVCPSTAQQTTLDLAESPSADHLFVMEPPGFHLHRVGEGPVVTHTIPVGDHPGILAVTAEARAGWTTAEPRALLAKRREHGPSA